MKTVEVAPYGVITTQAGGKYYLLARAPVEPEDWMRPQQQKFLVSAYNPGVGQKRHLITTDPDIELYSDATLIIEILAGGDGNG